MNDDLLSEIANSRAQFWYFTPSHSRLAVAIRKEGKRDRYVSFVFCQKIDSPTHWNVQNPKIEKEADLIVYRDDVATIHCQEISIWDHSE